MRKLRPWMYALVLCAMGLSFCGRSGSTNKSDIYISISAATLKLAPGQTGQLSITVRANAALPGPVVMSLSGSDGKPLPQGFTFAFEPAQLSIDNKGEKQTRLRVALLPTIEVSDYVLSIYGKSEDREESADLVVNVTGASTTWQRQIGTPRTEMLSSLNVDNEGNLLVGIQSTGQFGGIGNAGEFDGFLLKYHANGSLEWATSLGTAGSDLITASAIDADNNIYIAGYTYGAFPGETGAGSADCLLAKFGPNGNLMWLKQFGTDQVDQLLGIALDKSGHLYVAGLTEGIFPGQTNAGGQDLMLAKFSTDGKQDWLVQFGSDQHDRANGVAVDAQGSAIYIIGGAQGALPGNDAIGLSDMALGKFLPDSTQVWLKQFGSLGDDVLLSVTVDDAGAVYATGTTKGVFPGQIQYGGIDALLVKYQPDGTRVYARQFGTSYTDLLNAVKVVNGRVYTAGGSRGTFPGQIQAGSQDAFIARHSNEGAPEWMWQFGTNGSDYCSAITAYGDTLYLGGVTFGALEHEYAAGEGDAFLIQNKLH